MRTVLSFSAVRNRARFTLLHATYFEQGCMKGLVMQHFWYTWRTEP